MLDLPTQLEPLKSSFTWKGIRIKMMGSSIEGEFDIESNGPYFIVFKPKPRVNFFMKLYASRWGIKKYVNVGI